MHRHVTSRRLRDLDSDDVAFCTTWSIAAIGPGTIKGVRSDSAELGEEDFWIERMMERARDR
jgi:hypothetical protein